jgi:hypothetical protein
MSLACALEIGRRHYLHGIAGRQECGNEFPAQAELSGSRREGTMRLVTPTIKRHGWFAGTPVQREHPSSAAPVNLKNLSLTVDLSRRHIRVVE